MTKHRESKGTHKLPDKPREEFRPVDPNQAVLNLLSRSSTDLTRARPVTFYLYFDSRSAAMIAADRLTALGFSTECTKSAKQKEWLCLASKEIVLKVGLLISIHRALDCLANELGGDYDGWETELSVEERKGLPGIG